MLHVTFGFALVLLLITSARAQELARVTAIPGVVAAGAVVELVKEGFQFTEGPVATSDESVYFTDIPANRIYRLSATGAIEVFREKTAAANGLALDPAGNLVAVEGDGKRVIRMDRSGNVTPVAATAAGGRPFLRPNDLIVDRRGGIYVSDPGPRENTAKAFVYYVRPDGQVILVSDEIARPNGLTLTLDGKVLLVDDTRGDTIFAFDVQPDGSAVNKRPFGRLRGMPTGQPSVADGMALDSEGRVYVTTVTGIQVLAANGDYLGTIPVPRQPSNLAFGGAERRTLYITAREGVYRLRMLSQGADRPGK